MTDNPFRKLKSRQRTTTNTNTSTTTNTTTKKKNRSTTHANTTTTQKNANNIRKNNHGNKIHHNHNNKAKSALSRVLHHYKKIVPENPNSNNSSSSRPQQPQPKQQELLDEKSITQTSNLLTKCTTIVDKLIQKQSALSSTTTSSIGPNQSWLLYNNNNDNNAPQNLEEQEIITTTFTTIEESIPQKQLQQCIQQYKDIDKLIQVISQESTKVEFRRLITSSPKNHVKTIDSLNKILTNCLILCSQSLPPKYWNVHWNTASSSSSTLSEDCYDSSSSSSSSSNNDHNSEDYIDKNDQQRIQKGINLDTSSLLSPLENSMKVYHLLQQYNIDIQPIHYESIIKTAIYHGVSSSSSTNTAFNSNSPQIQGYDIASKLFKKQIDVDDSAYVPIDSRLGWDSPVEMGLFGIAMNVLMKEQHQQQGSRSAVDEKDGDEKEHHDIARKVGKEVLDAVDEMCMVSSTDQERCKY